MVRYVWTLHSASHYGLASRALSKSRKVGGESKVNFGVYPSWSSQGMPHDIEVPSGGGFQAVSLTGILFVWPYPRA